MRGDNQSRGLPFQAPNYSEADSVTGGGLHGKDLSKGDVSMNIYAWLKAQETGKLVQLSCAIGDDTVDDIPYGEILKTA